MGVIRVTVLREPQEPSRDEGTVDRRGNRLETREPFRDEGREKVGNSIIRK